MIGSFKSHKARVAKVAVKPAPRRQSEASDAPGKAAASNKVGARPNPKEIGGPSGPEPTRYGDWERKGICVDF